MSGGGSKSSSTKVGTMPAWMQERVESMLDRSQRLSRQEFKPWEGKAILRKNKEERKAQRGIRQMYDAGERQEHGQGVASLDAASRRYEDTPMWDESQYQKYASPYFENVIDIEKREAARDAAILAKNLRSNAVGAGAFGGTREAVMQSGLQRNLLQNLSDIEHKGRQSAWDNARNAFGADREASRLAAQGQADVAAQYMNFAKQGQSQQFERIAALAESGASDRELEQAALDFAISQYDQEQQWERNILGFHASILRGIPTVPVGTSHGSSSTKEGGSGLGNILGAIGGIASIFASDRNLKKNISPSGLSPSGIPEYTFEYIDESIPGVYHGVMAQDIMEDYPSAVVDTGEHLAVNYSLIDADFYRVR